MGCGSNLRPTGEYGDKHFKAQRQAYHQPVRALLFAEQSIAEGRIPKDLPELVKYAAYNFERLQRACGCLQERGIGRRRLRQHPPRHPRLKGTLRWSPIKPVEYNAGGRQVRTVALGLPLTRGTVRIPPYDFLEWNSSKPKATPRLRMAVRFVRPYAS